MMPFVLFPRRLEAAILWVMLAALPTAWAEPSVESPAVHVRSNSTAAFQRSAAELQRSLYHSTLQRATIVVVLAEAGACPEPARRRAERYRDILASAVSEAGKAEAVAENHPARAAALYRRAERIAGGILAGAQAIGCTPEGGT